MTDEKKRTEALRIQFEYEKNGIKHLDPIEMFVAGCDFAIAETSKDLTTAKEIIKTLIYDIKFCSSGHLKGYSADIEKAEQFISRISL